MLGKEIDFGPQEILGDNLLRRHVRDTAQGEDIVRPPRFQQRTRELQCVSGEHVVVREAMNEQQGASQGRGARQERCLLVRGVVVRGVPQVPLGVCRVVEPPVSHRSSGDRGVEDIGTIEHRERGEIAAELPTPNTNARKVECVV